jgi:hypothetical protein
MNDWQSASSSLRDKVYQGKSSFSPEKAIQQVQPHVARNFNGTYTYAAQPPPPTSPNYRTQGDRLV